MRRVIKLLIIVFLVLELATIIRPTDFKVGELVDVNRGSNKGRTSSGDRAGFVGGAIVKERLPFDRYLVKSHIWDIFQITEGRHIGNVYNKDASFWDMCIIGF